MSVNIQGLKTELEKKGTVIYCDNNSESNFVVVMDDVFVDRITIDEIVDAYISEEFSSSQLSTLKLGVYKCDYSK